MLSACGRNRTVKADLPVLQQGGHLAITVVKRELTPFGAMTAGRLMLGANHMVDVGNALVKDNHVEDPAVAIADALSRALADQLSLPVRLADNPLKSTNPAAIAKQYPGAGLLLDIQTFHWGLVFHPMDWDSYAVVYSVKMRLVDTSTGKLVAEGVCTRAPKHSADAPSYEELVDNNAAGLKERLKRSGEQCQEELKSKALGLL